MQKVDPMINQIGQLLDARFKTFATNIKGEIKAEIKASEERVTKNLRAEIKASEERVTKNLKVVEYKLDGKVAKLEKRTERLEIQTGIV